ncbi:MAG: acyl-CoA thioesterase [Polyangiales bacterium]
MTSHFDRDTALTSLGQGRFAGRVSEDFWVQSGPNGGYLAAIALRGAMAMVPEPERTPRSLHVRFVTAPTAGPFELHAEVVRSGRSMTTVGVRMQQAGRDFLLASACFSQPFSAVSYQDCRMPEARPLEQSEPIEKQIPLNQRYDMWRAIGAPLRTGERALTGGYLRFADPRVVDALSLAAFWDAWPPSPFARKLEQRFRGAAPTVEVTLYFRRPVPLPTATPEDYVLLRVESTMAYEGIAEESAEIWSLDGALLAQGRQLLLLI